MEGSSAAHRARAHASLQAPVCARARVYACVRVRVRARAWVDGTCNVCMRARVRACVCVFAFATVGLQHTTSRSGRSPRRSLRFGYTRCRSRARSGAQRPSLQRSAYRSPTGTLFSAQPLSVSRLARASAARLRAAVSECTSSHTQSGMADPIRFDSDVIGASSARRAGQRLLTHSTVPTAVRDGL